MGNIVKLTCGHKVKRVKWRITMDASLKNEAFGAAVVYFQVCPKCYQQKKRTKRFISAERMKWDQ
jgi:hypothetical protein